MINSNAIAIVLCYAMGWMSLLVPVEAMQAREDRGEIVAASARTPVSDSREQDDDLTLSTM